MNEEYSEFKKRVKKGEELYKNKSNTEEAYVYYLALVDDYPANDYFKIRLAELMIRLRKWDEAYRITKELVQIDVPRFLAFKNHISILIKKGMTVEAREYLKLATQAYPEKKVFQSMILLLDYSEDHIRILKEVTSR